MKNYERELPIGELTLKIVTDAEKFEHVKNRLFYYLSPNNTWKRIDQGRYNFMAKNGYYVSYVDNANPVDTL